MPSWIIRSRLIRGFRPSRRSAYLFFFMIVGLISGMIAAIPNFMKFDAKARTAEARTNLNAIYASQVSYYKKHGSYAGGGRAFNLTGWSTDGWSSYYYFMADDVIHSREVENEILDKAINGDEWRLAIRPEVSDKGFTAMAIGNVDIDEYLDVWMINDDAVLTNIINDWDTNLAQDGVCDDCPWAYRPSLSRKLFTFLLGVLGLVGLIMVPAFLISIVKDFWNGLRYN